MIDCEVNSVLVGQIKPLGKRKMPSGIDKRPVEGGATFNEVGFVLDDQGDKQAHGGPEKAIHHYPFDHYQVWGEMCQEQCGADGYRGPDLSRPGAFGENISTLGVTEKDVCLGDVFALGTGKVQVVQGRQPCWKLNERFGLKTMARMVQKSGMTGWYYQVLEPGQVGQGDRLQLIERPAPNWSLDRVNRLLYVKTDDYQALEELACLPFLAASWKSLAQRRVENRKVEDWSKRLDGSQ